MIPYRNSIETLSIYKRPETETGEGNRDQNQNDTETKRASFFESRKQTDGGKNRKPVACIEARLALEGEDAETPYLIQDQSQQPLNNRGSIVYG